MNQSEWATVKASLEKAGAKIDETIHHRGDASKPHMILARLSGQVKVDIEEEKPEAHKKAHK